MKSVKRRIDRIEKKIKENDNPLHEIRKDLKPLLDIKKRADYRNLYDDGDGKVFTGNKAEEIKKYCGEMKSIIINLASKYKEESNE